MWTYKQSTGEMLRPDGTRFGFGFAGHGTGLNNPAMQNVKDIGPLPQGDYTMSEWRESDPKTGLCTIVLQPLDEKVMFGRAAFRIHGAVTLVAAGLQAFLNSSDGCIVIGDCILRRGIWASKDHVLKVIA